MYHRCGRRPAMSFWTSHLDLNDDRQRSKVQGLLRQSSEVDALFVACLVAPVQIRPQRRRSEKEIWRGDSDTAYREMMRRLTWRGDDWWTSREMQFALRPFHFHFLTSFRSNSGMFALHQWNIISVPVCRRWRRSSDWKWKKPIKLRQSPGWTCTKKANRHGFDLFFIFLRHFAIGSIWLELRKENHLQYFSLFFACSTHCFTSCIFFLHSRSFGITPHCSSLHGKTSPKMNSWAGLLERWKITHVLC